MNTVRIEVNGLDIIALAEKLDTLTNVLTGQTVPEPSTPENNNLITRRETAKILGVTLPTVIDWEKKGIITGYRIGNRIRYKEAEILEAVTNNKTSTAKNELRTIRFFVGTNNHNRRFYTFNGVSKVSINKWRNKRPKKQTKNSPEDTPNQTQHRYISLRFAMR